MGTVYYQQVNTAQGKKVFKISEDIYELAVKKGWRSSVHKKSEAAFYRKLEKEDDES